MGLSVCIHQPDFAPWGGFFQRLLDCDLFLLLDDAQFEKNGWHNRDRIKTAQGPRWLSLPVRRSPLGQLIRDVEMAPIPGWQEKLLNQVRESYRKAPFFETCFRDFAPLIRTAPIHMVDLNELIIKWMMGVYGLQVPTRRTSPLGIREQGNARLLAILKSVGATRYITGSGSRAYLDEAAFQAQGIQVTWQSWTMPSYPQLHGPFVGGLSSLDTLFNLGPKARHWLRHPGPSFEV